MTNMQTALQSFRLFARKQKKSLTMIIIALCIVAGVSAALAPQAQAQDASGVAISAPTTTPYEDMGKSALGPILGGLVVLGGQFIAAWRDSSKVKDQDVSDLKTAIAEKQKLLDLRNEEKLELKNQITRLSAKLEMMDELAELRRQLENKS